VFRPDDSLSGSVALPSHHSTVTTPTNATDATSMRAVALHHIQQGYAPIPVPYQEKVPNLPGWQHLRLTEETVGDYFNGHPQNISLLPGAPSGGLADIDLDAPETLALARSFLPATGMIHGRASTPESHRWYQIDPVLKTKRFEDPIATKQRAMLVEFRTNGAQTVIPPSVHPSGEPVEWVQEDAPLQINGHALMQAVCKLAAAALLARYWPAEGSRHHAALALAGGLLRAGWAQTDVEHFIRAVTSVAGDDEVEDRVRCVQTTAERLAANETATGWTHLKECVDPKVVGKVCEWLEVSSAPDVASAPTRDFRLTDYGNAERMVAAHGDDFRYCTDWGCFLVWDGTRWVRDNGPRITQIAKQTVREMLKDAANIQDDAKRLALVKHQAASESAKKLQAMIELVKSEPGILIDSSQLDRDPMLLNVLNGTIDLRTGQCRDHRREDLISKLAPVKYDASATCPEWEKFLDRIMQQNADNIGYIRRALGYSITGETGERVVFIPYGCGANGKSTLIETTTYILGDYATTTQASTLMTKGKNASGIPNDIAALRGARFVDAGETEENQRLAVALVKRLSGGDTMSARFLHGEFFNFEFEGKIWVGTNHRPTITESNQAIWDRVRLIPFNYRFPDHERDIHFKKKKLWPEASGILNFLIAGCLEWQAHGLMTPPDVIEANQEYRSEMDVVEQFLDAWAEREPTARTRLDDLYQQFVQWADFYGYDRLTKLELTSRLKEKGFQQYHTKSERGWQGIKIVDRIPATKMFSGPPPF